MAKNGLFFIEPSRIAPVNRASHDVPFLALRKANCLIQGILNPRFHNLGNLSVTPAGGKWGNYDYGWLKNYPDYGIGLVVTRVPGGEHTALIQLNHHEALRDSRRRQIVEQSMQEFMADCFNDWSGRTVSGVCLIGGRVAFFTMDSRTKIMLDENKELVIPGEFWLHVKQRLSLLFQPHFTGLYYT